MCSQYSIKFQPETLFKLFKSLPTPPTEDVMSKRVFPQQKAPVVFWTGAEFRIEVMRFGLIPRWSKEARLKYSTHNARLEDIEAKASFKEAFVKRHCLVPLSSFFEAVYRGPTPGNLLEFSAQESDLLMAAGIWEEWINKVDGEIINSFAILTHAPDPYIFENGHDRSPLFIDKSYWKAWLQSQEQNPESIRAGLLNHKQKASWASQIERPLKNAVQKT
jgi:putative SOS response-associated peptidase YedK